MDRVQSGVPQTTSMPHSGLLDSGPGSGALYGFPTSKPPGGTYIVAHPCRLCVNWTSVIRPVFRGVVMEEQWLADRMTLRTLNQVPSERDGVYWDMGHLLD